MEAFTRELTADADFADISVGQIIDVDGKSIKIAGIMFVTVRKGKVIVDGYGIEIRR